MKYTLFLMLLCSSVILTAQDMSGEWNGMLSQEEGGIATSYYFSMQLIHEGKKIKGISRVTPTNNPTIYGIMELVGEFDGKQLKFEEIRIKKEDAPGVMWCLKKGILKFTIKKDGFCVEGTWAGQLKNGVVCTPGKLTLCKIVPIAGIE